MRLAAAPVRLLLAGALLLALAPQAVHADKAADKTGDRSGDHERARAAVRAGEVLPLPVLLEKLQRSHPGQVLELELERDDGRWIYELKLLQADGQLLKLEVDARSAQVLQVRRKDGGKSGRRTEPGAAATPAATPASAAATR
jgi:uncharacterized membrane protein YkoI